MLSYAVVPIILLVVAALLWTWWTSRQDRDPASSVDSFNRALTAMQPGSAPARSRRRANVKTDEEPVAGASSEDGDDAVELEGETEEAR